jgi:TetR/AcrR family transcriptional regulator, transcriptional repressor for nem operon
MIFTAGSEAMSRAASARERILEIAEEAVLSKGFQATSIDEIIAAAGITKSGFFYHFPDKTALAREMLDRYLVNEETLLNEMFARARELSDDPLQTFLIGLKFLAEAMYDLPEAHPGCLVATYCYQERLFDSSIRDRMRDGVLKWRSRFLAHIAEIEEQYRPKEDIDREALADMVNGAIEGGIVMSKALGNPRLLGDQVMLFRSLVKVLFEPKRQ